MSGDRLRVLQRAAGLQVGGSPGGTEGVAVDAAWRSSELAEGRFSGILVTKRRVWVVYFSSD